MTIADASFTSECKKCKAASPTVDGGLLAVVIINFFLFEKYTFTL